MIYLQLTMTNTCLVGIIEYLRKEKNLLALDDALDDAEKISDEILEIAK